MKNFIYSSDMSFGHKLSLFFFNFFICLLITSLITQIVTQFADAKNVAVVDATVVIQNLFMFILPVILTMFFITLKPMRFLNLNVAPSWQAVVFVFIIFIVSVPSFNYLVDWNNNITLPESMKPVEEFMRSTEDSAKQITDFILKETNIWLCILIVGVLTGISEELFFRGMLQKILFSRPTNIHIAIWCAAFIFSALHFQFFGFFPRLILGAFFGYLVYWSGSLWTAIIAHTLNNSVVILTYHLYAGSGSSFESIGVANGSAFPWLALGSLLMTVGLLIIFKSAVIRNGKPYSTEVKD